MSHPASYPTSETNKPTKWMSDGGDGMYRTWPCGCREGAVFAYGGVTLCDTHKEDE